MNQLTQLEELLEKTLAQTEQIVADMRTSVSQDLVSRDKEYLVYSGIVKRDEVRLMKEGLSLVRQKDQVRQSLELDAVKKATEKGLSIVVDELFITREDVTFLEGKLVTNFREFQVRFRLQRNLEYGKAVEKLREQFYKNRISYQPLFTPYFYRFYYVVLEPVVIAWKPEEVLERIEIEKQPLEGCYEEDMVPVWNIAEKLVHNRGERIFVEDGIYYHYEFEIGQDADGILIDYEDRILRHFGMQADGKLVIETRQEEASEEWKMLTFCKIDQEKRTDDGYPLISNQTKEHFMGRYGGYFGTPVLSLAELRRKLNSYKDGESVEFLDADIVYEEEANYDTYPIPGSQLYGMEDRRPYLILRFRMTGVRPWLARDTMSFLAASAGMEFTAYHVVGRLVDKQQAGSET